jgi:hypothetical protein
MSTNEPMIVRWSKKIKKPRRKSSLLSTGALLSCRREGRLWEENARNGGGDKKEREDTKSRKRKEWGMKELFERKREKRKN